MRRLPAAVEYRTRRNARAKRISVRVDNRSADVIVTLPRWAGQKDAAAAVAELTPWIEARLAEVAATRAQVAARGGTVPYLGTALAVVGEPGRAQVLRRGDALHVPDDEDAAGEAIERWLRRQARAEVVPRLDAACAALGTSYSRLTIRDQRTRWGSCTAKGVISINWRLVLAPEHVLDYVVWHEACHLLVLDHSPRFWALVERHVPEHRRSRRWLKDHGSSLVL